LIKCVRQDSRFIIASLGRTNRIVIVIRNCARRVGQPQDRIGDETQELPREHEGNEERRDQNEREDAPVELQQLGSGRTQIGQQGKRPLLSPTQHHRLSEDDAVTVDCETGFQPRRFNFGFVA
jgi:hypothetical protein